MTAGRVNHRVGDVVALRSDRSRVGAVIEVLDSDAEVRYRVLIDGDVLTLYGSQVVRTDSSGDGSAQIGAEECKALLTALHLRSSSTSTLMSLRTGRVEFVPYQYRPVLKLIRSDRPRLLIADEVGVGKTIEAGLIIKELRARSGLSSVLVICPKPLVSERKWELEMRRFDERFHPLDGPTLRFCINETHLDGEWPRRYSNAILPMSLLNEATLLGKRTSKGQRARADRGLIDLDPPPRFDLCGSIRRGELADHLVRVDMENAREGWSVTKRTDGVARGDAARKPRRETHWFLRFREPHAQGSSWHLDVVFELQRKEPDRAAQAALPMDDGAPCHQFCIVPSERGRVAVFFPAEKETSNLRFHLHAPFIPELSRASIKEHPDNAALVGRLAELVARSLPAIRDLGLLDREFLGVLPNSKDAIRDEYSSFHEAVVHAMREEPLVPMRGGGHGKATRLLRGPARGIDFLGMDDCRFQMSGWDRKNGYTRMNRSATPEPDYDGWAVSATQRNNKVDRLLADLEMDEFKVEYVVPPESRTAAEIAKWLATHDSSWHRAWYASLKDHLADGTLQRLQQLPVVRTRSGKYRPAAECRFVTDGEEPEGVAIVDLDTYSLDRVIDDGVKAVLQRLGVREIDDESKFKGILEKYYGQPGRQPEWEEHRRHVETFIDFMQREHGALAELESKFRAGSSGRWADRRESQMRLKAARKALAGSQFLLSRHGHWLQPDRLYAGGDSPNSPASYYRCLARLPRVGHCRPRYLPQAFAVAHMRPSRRELDSRYRDIPRFDEFARWVGVVYEIPIRQAKCERNPEFRHLESGGGSQWTRKGTDRDWKAPDRLANVLKWLEQGTADLESERENLARAIHAALDETRNDTWPPPDSCRWEDDVSGKLVAVYRRNTAAAFRTAPSQLVCTLRDRPWVPQKEESGGCVFVNPGEARPERLPEGLAFDPGWAWVKAVKFGEVPREEAPTVDEAGRDAEDMAKALGFRDLDAAKSAQRFAACSEEDQAEFWARREARNRPSEFPEPRNPARRREKARQEAREAPARGTELRQRSVATGDDKLKEEARTKLRAWYEEHARSSLCQVSDCTDRSFRLPDDDWYFEAVRFLRLSRMIAADYVALCPRHAAMFQHANEPRNDLKRTFEEAISASAASGNGAGALKIPIVLAGKPVAILLAPNHVIDLKAALDIERSNE